MASPNFYLRNPEATKETPIYLQLKHRGQKFTYSIGHSILPKLWDFDKQRAKSNKATLDNGYDYLNEHLIKIASHVERFIKMNITAPSTQALRESLDELLNPSVKSNLYELIDRFVSNEILYKGRKRIRTATYHTLKKHLQEFEKKRKYKITFETITMDFYYKYVAFLAEDLKLKPNTVGRDIKEIKAVMKVANKLGYTNNRAYEDDDFVKIQEEVESVYLTEEEIIQLYNYDLSHDKRLEEVRDLFVFGCFVGLRFGDYSNIQPEDIIKEGGEYFIVIKDGTKSVDVVVPCNPIVLDIFDRYKDRPNRLPPSLSNQYFNDLIKLACKEAKLTLKGRLKSNPGLALWECITSHTARRSFATNLYLEGFPILDIMKITGHKTETNFMKYVKITPRLAAKRLSAHNKTKDWSKLKLKGG